MFFDFSINQLEHLAGGILVNLISETRLQGAPSDLAQTSMWTEALTQQNSLLPHIVPFLLMAYDRNT